MLSIENATKFANLYKDFVETCEHLAPMLVPLDYKFDRIIDCWRIEEDENTKNQRVVGMGTDVCFGECDEFYVDFPIHLLITDDEEVKHYVDQVLEEKRIAAEQRKLKLMEEREGKREDLMKLSREELVDRLLSNPFRY